MKLKDAVSILDYRRIPISSSERAQRAKTYPYYGAQGIVDYIDDYLFDGEYVLVAEDGNNLKSLNEPIVTWATGRFWVNNHAHILGDCGVANIRYLYYLLMTSDLSGLITGSTQPKLNQENLANFDLNLPDRETQDRVAFLLAALDDKIANNKKLMAELEKTAQLIYDYWFTQFDFPDENGNPYRSSGGKMIWNDELKREIPELWHISTVNDLVEITKGVSYSSEDLAGAGVPMVNLASFDTDSSLKLRGMKTYAGTVDMQHTVCPGDLIMCATQQTSIDPTGKTNVLGKAFRLPDVFDETTLISTDVVKLIPVGNVSHRAVLDQFFRRPEIHKHMTGFANGTKIKHLDVSNAMDFFLALPNSDDLIDRYAKISDLVLARQGLLLRENLRLYSIRDWLLPLLMNGQATVEE